MRIWTEAGNLSLVSTLLLSTVVQFSTVHAGSTYQQNLASVRAVQIEIRLVGPDLSGVPGLDLGDLRSKIRNEAREILGQHEIEIASDSGQKFYILAQAKRVQATGTDQYAVVIKCKLDEEATLQRYTPELDGERVSWVTSWGQTSLFVAGAEDLTGAILGDISFFLEAFAGDVAAARSYGAKKASEGTSAR